MQLLSYLKNTSTFGITYSPDSEKTFYKEYSVDGKGEKVSSSEFNLFSDASWAMPQEDEFSITGSMMTLYGAPIARKSKKQTVRARSTCDAEYMAASDTTSWAEPWGGHLPFFISKTQ